jgi:GT2 family glycosyltransferase
MRDALAEHAVTAGRLEWAVLNDDTAQRSRALPQVDGLQHSEPLPWLPHASSSNLGIRTSLFRRLGGFDPAVRFLQDTDLCWRAQLAGADLAYVPDAVVHMRLRASLRGAWRQGRGNGMGMRWLAARYGTVAATHRARTAARSTATARSARAAAVRRTDLGHRLTRSWPWRIVRRAGLVGAEVLRVRTRGDVAALSWSTGFGVGYALGGLPDPAPYPGPVLA